VCSDKKDTVVVIFDEFTFFLKNLPERNADELLSFLRRMRMETPNLRMIYVGERLNSSMSRRGEANAVNDMHTIVIPELSLEAAISLARTLLEGSEIHFQAGVPHRIAEVSGGAPFLIRKLIWEFSLDRKSKSIERSDVDFLFAKLIEDPSDPFSTDHLGHMLAGYSKRDHEIALRLLRKLVDNPEGRMRSAKGGEISELRIIDELKRDGILVDDGLMFVKFRNELISRWVARWARDEHFRIRVRD
jgi:hypothetical protein